MAVIDGVQVSYRRVGRSQYDVVADASRIGLGLYCLGTISRDGDGWRIWSAKYQYRYRTRDRAAVILLADWSLRDKVQAVTHD